MYVGLNVLHRCIVDYFRGIELWIYFLISIEIVKNAMNACNSFRKDCTWLLGHHLCFRYSFELLFTKLLRLYLKTVYVLMVCCSNNKNMEIDSENECKIKIQPRRFHFIIRLLKNYSHKEVFIFFRIFLNIYFIYWKNVIMSKSVILKIYLVQNHIYNSQFYQFDVFSWYLWLFEFHGFRSIF